MAKTSATKGSAETHTNKLNSVYRRAAKHILPDPTLTTDQKMHELKLLPLRNHLLFNKGVMMYKIWNENVPKYLSSMFSKTQPKYSNSRQNFDLPLPRIDLFKTSLCFSGSILWYTLPSHVKNCHSFLSFKASLFRHFLSYKPP